MIRIIVALGISAAATAVLLTVARTADGACLCTTPMYALFPYGTYVMMRSSSDIFGMSLALIQFPIYVVVPTLIKETSLRLFVLVGFVVLHIAFAAIALNT